MNIVASEVGEDTENRYHHQIGDWKKVSLLWCLMSKIGGRVGGSLVMMYISVNSGCSGYNGYNDYSGYNGYNGCSGYKGLFYRTISAH